MDYYLLDHPNPNGDHFYESRNAKLIAIVAHITAGLQDLDTVDDHSCENTSAYAASTNREVSWHGSSDSDSNMQLLPPWYTAWHASNYNSCTYGWEICKTHTDWRTMPAVWVEKTLRQAAKGLAPIVRDYKIPLRAVPRWEVDKARQTGIPVGFVSHAELQPEDRTDPGLVRGVDTFPWGRLFELIAMYLRGEDPDELEDDEMGYNFNQVELPPTVVGETLERDVLFPDFGGAAQVVGRWVKVHGPGQPLDGAGAREVGELELSHFLDDAGNIVGLYAQDDAPLTHHVTLPSVPVPNNASKLVLRYRSVTGLNVSVQAKTE